MIYKLTILLFCLATFANCWRFTFDADPRDTHPEEYEQTWQAAKKLFGDEGEFLITAGDAEITEDRLGDLQNVFGDDIRWFPVWGNHEVEDMNEEQLEYSRELLKKSAGDELVNKGPAGSERTTFSWDHKNVHFVALNQYFDGESDSGDNTCTYKEDNVTKDDCPGNMIDPIYEWLKDDLEDNDKPFIFVIGHEPAFPVFRHLEDSLNRYADNRNRFWALLVEHKVNFYICGHTHYYSRVVSGLSNPPVYQIDAGESKWGDYGQPSLFGNVEILDDDCGIHLTMWASATEDDPFTLSDTVEYFNSHLSETELDECKKKFYVPSDHNDDDNDDTVSSSDVFNSSKILLLAAILLVSLLFF
ncbi:purple acid phosphatase [Anaeramoeba flamelloides]|uniref:Purple acid phosphatase n=1 Tax=Anaeramoeba flamelloides TaxID=1746091 RepID=A0AAV7Z6K4_9EUKA|nr:purple acid phosphatase [Anaeramoeba flamelloides]